LSKIRLGAMVFYGVSLLALQPFAAGQAAAPATEAAPAQANTSTQPAPDATPSPSPAAPAAAAAPETNPASSPAVQAPPTGPADNPQPGTASDSSSPQAATNPPDAKTAITEKPAAGKEGERDEQGKVAEITEDDLKQELVGKPLYLRGGYLDNNLTFNEHGALVGHSAQGSFTLSCIQIDKVHLTKHKLELEGARYGLHFLGALAYEDPTTAVDRVRITPKKKVVKITVDREEVLTRKNKNDKQTRGKKQAAAPAPVAPAASPALTTQTVPEPSSPAAADADQSKAETAAAPESERAADPASVTSTYSQSHANNLLKDALSRVFAVGIDDKLIASMPDCWKLYYRAQAANADYRPTDPTVLRQSAVDKKARLLTNFQPESNEYAQANSVSGMALYHTVIGPDGKPVEIAVGRPIGFGLDESAVDAIRKASFEPAIKDGKPVAVLLDLVVQFHIYSKRTAAASPPQDAGKLPEPTLPGPYSVQHPANPNAQ
jgi:TonB family protein